MKNILVLNTSPRGERSQSRKLTNLFIKYWKEQYPQDSIIFREIGKSNIPHVTEEWISGAFSDAGDHSQQVKKTLALSDTLVAEFLQADVYVVGVPMYNWSIPSGFKAYIDQIMRINKTWKFESGKPDGKYVGLVKDKKMYLISTRGDFGYQQGQHNSDMNFQTPYLKTVFGIMGITNITEFILENEEYGGLQFEKSVERTRLEIGRQFNRIDERQLL